MKFSVAVEYALHGLIYMAGLEENKSIRIQDMSRFQGISESYLSKTYAKLAKAGIITSAAGAGGGYRLSKPAEQISFWDVIEAIEGKEPLFRCEELRCKSISVNIDALPEEYTNTPCLISKVMHDAENEMKRYLSGKNIGWLYDQVFNRKFSPEEKERALRWFREHSN